MSRRRRRGPRTGAPLAPLVLLLALGCGDGPSGPPARLWTLFDPAPADPGAAAGVRLVFRDRVPAAVFMGERWTGHPEVWAQPLTILVTRWDAQAPGQSRLPGARPIFSVGPGATFYSPFWLVQYAVVPDVTPVDRYRTGRDLLADEVPLHPGPGRLVALAPPGGPAPDDPTGSLPERLGLEVARPVTDLGWVEGREEPVRTLDFGEGRFRWNDRREVEEQPLFVFYSRTADGSWQPAGVPDVAGTGPLFAPRPLPGSGAGATPVQSGALFRLHAVRLPAEGADPGVFLPAEPAFDTLRAELTASVRGLAVPVQDWRFARPESAFRHALRVALNASACFADEPSLATCRWLDSQAAIEAELPAAISPTEVTVTAPFVAHEPGLVRP